MEAYYRLQLAAWVWHNMSVRYVLRHQHALRIWADLIQR